VSRDGPLWEQVGVRATGVSEVLDVVPWLTLESAQGSGDSLPMTHSTSATSAGGHCHNHRIGQD
jgi:hypothetical protein